MDELIVLIATATALAVLFVAWDLAICRGRRCRGLLE